MFGLWMTARIVANPVSNVFQKKLTQRGVHPLLVVCITHGILSLICVPFLFYFELTVEPAFWKNIAICTVLNIAGNTLLIQAVKLSDLSVIGPINAYKPVMSLIPSFLLLRETPGLLGIAGMALILAGSYFLVDRNKNVSGPGGLFLLLKDRGVQYRFAALIATALEAAFLKAAVQDSNPWVTFALWSLFGFVAAAATVVVWGGSQLPREAAASLTFWPIFVGLGLTVGTMQVSTIIVLEQYQVGYSLALFQTSAILSVVLGYRIFQEPNFLWRLVGSAVMALGAALIILGG